MSLPRKLLYSVQSAVDAVAYLLVSMFSDLCEQIFVLLDKEEEDFV